MASFCKHLSHFTSHREGKSSQPAAISQPKIHALAPQTRRGSLQQCSPDPIVKLGDVDGGVGRGTRNGRTRREAEVERGGG